MVPVVPAAVSLFGAALGPASASTLSLPPASPAVPSAGTVLLGVNGVSTAAPAPFADLLVDAVGQVGKLEDQAKTAVEGLMSGAGVDVHEAMIATEKAGMGFDLALAVRNKALAAYQQVMGMQF